MKKYLFPALLIISVILTGCTTVTQTTYLQNIEISGPINPPPIRVIDGQKTGDISISTSFAFNQTSSFKANTGSHSYVNSAGVYQIDTLTENGKQAYAPSSNNTNKFEGKNLLWNLPDLSFTFNSVVCLSDHIDLNLGVNFASQNHHGVFGGNAGLGFFSQKENSAFRFNIGVLWHQLYYDANSAIVTGYKFPDGSSKSVVNFYEDQNKFTTWNPYVSLTYNSVMKDFPFNYFLNLGLFGETIYDFSPSSLDLQNYPFSFSIHVNDTRGEGTATFFTYGGGIFVDLMDNLKLSAGVRFFNETAFDGTPSNFYALPVLQIDMNF